MAAVVIGQAGAAPALAIVGVISRGAGTVHRQDQIGAGIVHLRGRPTRPRAARAANQSRAIADSSAVAIPDTTGPAPSYQAVRPAGIFVSGDGSALLGGRSSCKRVHKFSRASCFGHIAWTSWTSSHAIGRGELWLDNGIPNVARGTFTSLPVTIQASDPHRGLFTRLSYTLTGQTPSGQWPRTTRLKWSATELVWT